MNKTRSSLGLFAAATFAAVFVAFAGCTQSGTTPPPLVGTINPPPGPGTAALVVTDSHTTSAGSALGFDVFLPTDSGTPAPQAAVKGSNTTLHEVKSAARDANGNFYLGDSVDRVNFSGNCIDTSPTAPPGTQTVLDEGRLVIFDRTANGNAFPASVIAGPLTTLDDSVNGIAVDSSKNIFVSQDDSTGDTCANGDTFSNGNHTARIMEFSGIGASGNVPPTSWIAASTTTRLTEPEQLTLVGSRLWVANSNSPNKAVLAFDVGALLPGNNNNAPAIRITSSCFSTPDGVAVDSSNNVYVADDSNSKVFVFTSVTSDRLGATPNRVIRGFNLLDPHQVATDGTFLYVSNSTGGINTAVFVYNITDGASNGTCTPGTTAPVRKIFDASSSFEPKGLSL